MPADGTPLPIHLERRRRHVRLERQLEEAYTISRASKRAYTITALARHGSLWLAADGRAKRRGMSAAPPIQGINRAKMDRWSVPLADSCTAANPTGSVVWLFDYLVGDGEQPRREAESERLGGVQVDDELELGRLLDRKIGRLGALDDFIDACVQWLTMISTLSRTSSAASSVVRSLGPMV
jgi:hypothetical protein